MSAELNFESILEHFYVEGKVVDCVRYGEGHINAEPWRGSMSWRWRGN